MAALGAVDIALWDINGKLAGLPIYKMLGGPHRDRVRVYTHLSGPSPEALAEQAREKVQLGFDAVRFYPLGDRKVFSTQSYQAIVRTAERNVAAVRKAVGPEVDVLIDVVCLLTPRRPSPWAARWNRRLKNSLFGRLKIPNPMAGGG